MSAKRSDRRVLIVEARFYPDLADEMKAGAAAVLEGENVPFDVVEVPGALEIAPAVAIARKAKAYSGFIALGCVIRGETTHYDYVAGESIRGLQRLAVRHRLAVGTGILTVENRAQAEARASRNRGNKGAAAAAACLALMGIKARFGASRK